MEIRHWIQRADFSSTELGVASQLEVIRLLRDYPWQSELETLSRLEAKNEASCPPGLGLVISEGRILHFCPNTDGAWEVLHNNRIPRKLLGIIPSSRSISESFSGVSTSHAELLVAQFFQTGVVDLSTIK